MIARIGFALVAVSLVCVAARAEIYRWTDASGREQFSMHLSDVPESQRAAALEAAGASGQSLSGFHSESRHAPAPPIEEAPIGASPLPASLAPPSEPLVGGRTETTWRKQAQEHRDAVARAEERLAACEATDARRRMSSGLTGLDACAANESAIEHAEDALARFEDLARSKDVPPGWLR